MKFVRLAVLSVVSVSFRLCVATAADAPASARKEEAPEIAALRENALLGIGDAQYKLGLAYIEGRGVPVDPVEGFVWLRLAIEKGVTGKALHTVLETLDADQVKAARQRLASLIADNPNLRPNAPAAAPRNPPATPTPAPPKAASAEPVSKSPASGAPASIIPPADTGSTATPVATRPSPSSETKRPQDPIAVVIGVKRPLDQKANRDAKDVSQLNNQPGKETSTPIVFPAAQGSVGQTPLPLAQRPTEIAPERAGASAARARPVGEPTPVGIEVPTTTIADAAAKEASAALQRERNAHLATQAMLEQLRSQLTELSTSRTALEREFAAEIAAAERTQRDAAAEMNERTAEKEELSDKVHSLAAELRDARAELATVHENLTATSAKAVGSEIQASEIAALKKRLSSSTDELEAAKAALASANSKAQSELSTSRAALEREFAARIAAAERMQRDAAAELIKRTAEKAELSDKVNSLATELRDARAELATIRENLAATNAKAVGSEIQASEIAALKKRLSSSTDELEAAKAALAAAISKAQSAESREPGAAQTELLNSLRSEVRILERDLQSATAALRNVTADKAAVETALSSANQQLRSANNELPTLRQRVAEADLRFANGGDRNVIALRGELNETKFRLSSAEKQVRMRDEELKRLRVIMAAADSRSAPSTSEIEAARRAANEARQQLAVVTQELAALRPQAAGARELESRLRQLEAEKANAQAAQSGSSREEFARLTAAHATAEAKLSTALKSFAAVSKERDELRAQASAARVLEARVRQLESEKGGVPNKDEFARVVAAQAAAENNLSTALRSYSLLAKERDELRARLTQLSAPTSRAGEAVGAVSAVGAVGAPAKAASTTAAERRTEAR